MFVLSALRQPDLTRVPSFSELLGIHDLTRLLLVPVCALKRAAPIVSPPLLWHVVSRFLPKSFCAAMIRYLLGLWPLSTPIADASRRALCQSIRFGLVFLPQLDCYDASASAYRGRNGYKLPIRSLSPCTDDKHSTLRPLRILYLTLFYSPNPLTSIENNGRLSQPRPLHPPYCSTGASLEVFRVRWREHGLCLAPAGQGESPPGRSATMCADPLAPFEQADADTAAAAYAVSGPSLDLASDGHPLQPERRGAIFWGREGRDPAFTALRE